MGRRAVALLLLLVTLSGCWSRIELNDLGVVLGIAVDVGEEKPVRLTLFVPHPQPRQGGGAAGTQGENWVVAREAENISDAMALIRLSAARRLVYYHLRVVLVSEEIARTMGVGDLLDALANIVEVRQTVRLFVVEGQAQTVFETFPQLRNTQPDNLVGMIQAFGWADWKLKNILVARSSTTHTAWMHMLKVIKRPAKIPGSPETAATLSGAALFRKDHLVEKVHPWENQAIAWFLGDPKHSLITAPCPEPTEGSLTVEVLRGRAKIQPGWQGEKPAFQVEVTARVNLRRSQCRMGSLKEEEGRRELEQVLEEDLRLRIEAFVATLQESRTDPVGFGKRMQLAYPAYFRSVGDDWLEKWPEASVKVSARVTLVGAGLMVSPASKTETELREQRK